MADNVRETVLSIRVDNDKAIGAILEYSRAIEECKQREKDLKKSIQEGTDTTGAQAKELLAVVEARKHYTRQTQLASKELQNNIKQQQGAEGSLKSLRAQLSNLTKQYDELSKAERESAKGEELKNHINEITDEIKGNEEATQRYFRNVGNYANSLSGIFGSAASSAGQAASGILSMIKTSGGIVPAMKAIGRAMYTALGPIGALVGVVVGAFTGLKKVISSSEELTHQSSQTFAVFRGVIEGVKNAVQFLAQGVLNLVNAWMQFVHSIAEGAGKVASWLGIDALNNAVDSADAYIAKIKEIATEKNEIEKDERKQGESNADAELKIAKLRANAAEKNKFTAQERLKMLKKANDEEEKMSRENFELAKRKYEVLQKEAELSENSAEANEKLSQSYVEMRQAEIAYFNKRKELAAQMVEAENQIEADRKKRRDAWKAKLKENRTLEEENIDTRIELMEEGLEKEYEIEKRRYELVLKEIKARNTTQGPEGTRIKNEAIELAQQEHYKNIIALYINHANEFKAAEEEFQAFLLQSEKDTNKEIEQIAKEYRDNEILSRQNDIAAAKLKEQDTFAMEIELKKYELDTLHQLEEESNEEFRARQLAAEKAYNEAVQAQRDANAKKAQEAFDAQVARWDAAGGAIGQLSKVVEAFGEDSKEAAIAAKAIAIGEIAVQTGVAIAKGVAASAAAGPFPANLAAILTTVATVLANIASATSIVKSAKFATGGYVSGPGTATSDSIPAQLSNGESVLNAQATSMFAPILSPLNQMGGGVPIVATQSANQVQGEDMLARAFAKGMSEANIRVGVDEISRVQNRVKVIENIGVL